MLVKLFGAAVQGIDATIITIETTVAGLHVLFSGTARLGSEGESPAHHLGFASKRLQKCPPAISLSTWHRPTSAKEGSAHDLPLAVACLQLVMKPFRRETFSFFSSW